MVGYVETDLASVTHIATKKPTLCVGFFVALKSGGILAYGFSSVEDELKDAIQERTPEAAQEVAKKNYAAFLARIPAKIQQREAGLALEVNRLNAKPLVKLARIRQSAETLFSYANEFVACKKGCNFCCHQSIQISSLEASYIASNTGVRPVALTAPIYRDPLGFSGKTPCPFLKQGECSIYEFRPLICRIHVSLDVDEYWCRFENWHQPGAGVPKPTFRSIADAFSQLNEKSKSVVADIRDFFPIVHDLG